MAFRSRGLTAPDAGFDGTGCRLELERALELADATGGVGRARAAKTDRPGRWLRE
jgi:hypothetical protein